MVNYFQISMIIFFYYFINIIIVIVIVIIFIIRMVSFPTSQLVTSTTTF